MSREAAWGTGQVWPSDSLKEMLGDKTFDCKKTTYYIVLTCFDVRSTSNSAKPKTMVLGRPGIFRSSRGPLGPLLKSPTWVSPQACVCAYGWPARTCWSFSELLDLNVKPYKYCRLHLHRTQWLVVDSDFNIVATLFSLSTSWELVLLPPLKRHVR